MREGRPLTPQQADDDLDAAVEHARLGDEASFVLLYRTLHPRIVRYAAGLVGADADDVAAEAWLQVARDLPTFRGDADGFRAWVTRITRNRALDHHRARTRRPVVLDDVLALGDRPASDDTARDAVERLATAQAVALVASLPREQAEVVLLRAVVGLDVNDTAAVLGKKPGAVRVAAHRGLKRLAAELGRRSHTRSGGPNEQPDDQPADRPTDPPTDPGRTP